MRRLYPSRHKKPLLLCARWMRQNAFSSRRLPVSLGTADGSNAKTNSSCNASTALCIWLCLRTAVSEHKMFKCKFCILPVLLLPFVFPHLPTWSVSPSVVAGVMVYCQAEPISCPLWQWQHSTDTAKDNISARVAKSSLWAVQTHGTAGGNQSLSSLLDAMEAAVNVAESVESFTVLLKLCGTAIALGSTFPSQRCC